MLTSTSQETRQRLHILLPADKIKEQVKDLAALIRDDYQGGRITFLVILKGAFIFAADLIRELECPVEVEFIRCSSYHSGSYTSGEVSILYEPETLEDKDVLIVEDIVDTGLTIDCAKRRAKELGAKSVKVAALLDKPSRRLVEIDVDYRGFEIPDVFVQGYGIDYAESGRELRDVCIAVTEEEEEETETL